MRFLFALIVFAMSSVTALADEMPSWWSLPDKGENCSLKSVFHQGIVLCGTEKYETWTCIETGKSGQSGRAVDYLIVGEYQSDVADQCSPTFVVKKVLRQR